MPPTNTSPDLPSAPNPPYPFITPNMSHVMTQECTGSVKENLIYWLHQGYPQVYNTNGSNMQHINSRQAPPEEHLVRELVFYRHSLCRASDTRRGVLWLCEPGTYHHELNCNENDKECKSEAVTLGATIPRISTSILLKLMDYDKHIRT